MTAQILEKPKEVGKRAMLAVADLIPNPANRKVAKDEEIKTLAQSINEVGLLHPLIVRHHAEESGKYSIIAGERRWRALKRLGMESAPCLLVGSDESSEADVLGVVENHHRKALTPMEEAQAVRALLEQGMETEAIARSLGRSRAWVARRSSLTDLSEKWLAELADADSKIGKWPPSHLELIARFPAEVQDRMLGKNENRWQWNVPTLADLKAATGDFLHLIAAAPWKADDDTLVSEAGACANCPKRASCVPDLFEEELLVNGKTQRNDRCLDPICWEQKAKTFLKRRTEEVKAEHEDFALLVNDENADDVDVPAELEDQPLVFRPDVTLCKKSDKRAFPALVIAGPGIGRIKWVQLPKETKVRSNGVHAEHPNGISSVKSSGEKTLDQKREPYDRRRRQVVIEAVKAKLEALAKEKSLAKVASIEGGSALVQKGIAVKTLFLLNALLSPSGWRKDVRDSLPAWPSKASWEVLDTVPNSTLGSGKMREWLEGRCWELIRLALGTLISRHTTSHGDRTNDAQYAEAVTLCSMLGFDLAALRARAAETIPYAKSWKDEVKDDWQSASSATESVSP